MLFPLLQLLVAAGPEAPFEAPLPAGVALVKQSSELDTYGQRVAVAIYESPDRYAALTRFYRGRMKARRLVKVHEQIESREPGYVPDPADPNTFVPVLRVVNLDYTQPWAAVYVRALPEGVRVVVVQRKPPPEVESDSSPPVRIEIPRALFEIASPLTRD